MKLYDILTNSKGKFVKKDDFIYRPDLAKTLQIIADEGADAFYTGSLADDIIKDLSEFTPPSIITKDDLSTYSYKYRNAVTTTFRGYEILTVPPPFGGICTILGMNIIEEMFLIEENELSVHYTAETLRFMFSDRMALGDPDFIDLDEVISKMTDKKHAGILREKITEYTHPQEYYQDLADFTSEPDMQGTSHISVLDNKGNGVSMTSTVNTRFGSKMVGNRTGIIFNNQMDDFSTPGEINSYGLPPSPNNFIVPGKTPQSSMSPTIILNNNKNDKKVKMITGASGGSKIISATFQSIINVIEYEYPLYDAIQYGRIHDQLFPNELKIEITDDENHSFDETIINTLTETYGHNVTRFDKNFDEHIAVVSAIHVQDKTDLIEASSDERIYGEAAGY
eukprot:TRINITY_DN3030_c0_g1_i1.p1 TRINITY_DN3030_c0_g1~~TRINITY_DN3030_c0_g1_i1.p1  ORF type:complete len:395 (-),score=150.93 TRINITY_DN3030_c0_g1_i1:217-1401(-)